jgi:hypothetical protein
MQDVYRDISIIIDKITELPVFPSLVWVWTWDVLVSMYKDYLPEVDDEFVITMSLEDIWALFWEQADKNGFTLEYGTEDLTEHIRDWMIDQNILVSIEEEGDE